MTLVGVYDYKEEGGWELVVRCGKMLEVFVCEGGGRGRFMCKNVGSVGCVLEAGMRLGC